MDLHLRRTSAPAFAAVLAAALTLGTAGCSFEDDSAEREAEPAETDVAATDRTATRGTPGDVSTPLAGWRDVDRERLERERYDDAWRASAQREAEARRRLRAERPPGAGTGEPTAPSAASADVPVRALKTAAGGGAAPDGGRVQADPGTGTSGTGADDATTGDAGSQAAAESWEDIAPDAFSGEPAFPVGPDSAGPTVLRLQWMLDRARYSPGILDGRWGKNTEKAVYWLQDELGWETTGEPDHRLFDLLQRTAGAAQPVRRYTLSAGDVEGPFVTIPEEPAEQAELDCLCYASAEELLAEKFHTTADLLAQLNPGADLAAVRQGQSLWVPNVTVMERDMDAADHVDRIVVSKGGFYLHALDESGAILYHFPSTLGSEYDPSPSGEYAIASHAYDPSFHYQPELFPEVPDTEEDFMLPGGPNSPVGKVWLDLSKPNYGIHGTSAPETIGYTTSHGCVRLTNWDALFFANHVADGTPVEFRE
jgi:lipoprotein-anchoring transpeptidase ErfK/SrfK